jgi:magnesium-protoporphyrin O-methyltransferase
MPCHCCEITDAAFSADEARRALRDYRSNGPADHTHRILEVIRSLGLKHASLLDVGGGIGAIHHALLEDIADRAIHVDASSAFLSSAQQEAARLGHSDRVTLIHADFTDVAADLPASDIVTLDRVVCCYPDFRSLLHAAAGRARHVLALTYPRQVWYVVLGVKLLNFVERLRRDPFRAFVHPVQEMERLIEGQGFRRIADQRLFVWEVAVYTRQ